MANRHRAEVDASAFGVGCVLRLTTTEAAALEEQFGEAWIGDVMNGLDRLSPKAIKAVVELGLYNNKNNKIPADQIEWPTAPLTELKQTCADAVLLLLYGKTGDELRAEHEARAKAEAEAQAKAKAEGEGKPGFQSDPPATNPAGQ